MQLLLLFSHNLRPAPGQAWEGHEGGYNTEGHRGAPSPARKPDPRGIVAGQWAGGGGCGEVMMPWGGAWPVLHMVGKQGPRADAPLGAA